MRDEVEGHGQLASPDVGDASAFEVREEDEQLAPEIGGRLLEIEARVQVAPRLLGCRVARWR
jgi:hypothetical protein